ncbi:hypothetical protein [Myroides pelagicus]|uniref:PEGA domain-containing protein n=1 Tax=Myroides pelagicus TaxID=270914 RepID=A0A7K1GNV9_9FLAO|nr:hypothetical protein [Myroides pelagicus]MTH30585.1 hypothetical protein [Myroides pelagicus]
MRKIFNLMILTCFAVIGLSCSSDDNNTTPVDPVVVEKPLELIADQTEIFAGDTVKFTARSEKEVVEDVEIFIDQVKATNPYTFEQIGQYKVTAKAKGYKTSNTVTITVEEKLPILVLSIENPLPIVDRMLVTFIVKDNNGELVEDAEILLDGKKTMNPWPAEIGEHSFIATKEGYQTSDELKVTVIEPEPLFITTQFGENTIMEEMDVHFTVRDKNNTIIKDARIFVNGHSVSNPWKATAGQHLVRAYKDGYITKEPLEITVNAYPTYTGFYSYDGQTIEVNASELTFKRFELIDSTVYSLWWENTYSSNNQGYCTVEFLTPAIHNPDGSYTAVNPSKTTDITWLNARVYDKDNFWIFSSSYSEDFTGIYQVMNVSGRLGYIHANYHLKTKTGANKPFEIEFNGDRKVINYNF